MAQGYTPLTFAVAVLRGIGAPVTRQNVQGLVGWQKAEGGHWNNNARYNPLNTTRKPATGSYANVGTQGDIKSYTSWQQGLAATIATLKNGLYGNILAAFKKGNNAEAIGTAVGNSPWCPGCGQYATNVIRDTKVPAKIPSVTTVLGPTATPTPQITLASAAKATPPKTTTTLVPREVMPDTSLQGVISQLAAQQAQPSGPAITPGFNPGYSRYLSHGAVGGGSGFTPQAPSDIGSQIAGLSQLVGPSTFYDTKTTVTPGKVTPGKVTTTPASPSPSSAPSTPASGGSGTPDTSAKGTTQWGGQTVAAWIAPILTYAKQHGWKGGVNSGYRSYSEQAGLYAGLVAGTRQGPVAKPGTSNHEGSQFPRGAVDVSDAAGLSKVLQGSKYANVLVWAGGKDPVHFSHPHNGGY